MVPFCTIPLLTQGGERTIFHLSMSNSLTELSAHGRARPQLFYKYIIEEKKEIELKYSTILFQLAYYMAFVVRVRLLCRFTVSQGPGFDSLLPCPLP